jgi:hypothetical protein
MERQVTITDWTKDAPPKLANDSVRPGGGRMKWCSVGDMTGKWHRYPSGTGQVVPWDVMGDTRTEVEVCSSCLIP